MNLPPSPSVHRGTCYWGWWVHAATPEETNWLSSASASCIPSPSCTLAHTQFSHTLPLCTSVFTCIIAIFKYLDLSMDFFHLNFQVCEPPRPGRPPKAPGGGRTPPPRPRTPELPPEMNPQQPPFTRVQLRPPIKTQPGGTGVSGSSSSSAAAAPPPRPSANSKPALPSMSSSGGGTEKSPSLQEAMVRSVCVCVCVCVWQRIHNIYMCLATIAWCKHIRVGGYANGRSFTCANILIVHVLLECHFWVLVADLPYISLCTPTSHFLLSLH